MKPKYTPGPWEIRGYDVYQKHGRHICYNGPHHTQDKKYPPACKMQDESNARLIAAAPEMLEQLKYVVEVFGHDAECQCESCRYLKPVIDIIKKAEGEQ